MAEKLTVQQLLSSEFDTKLLSSVSFEDGLKLLETLVSQVEGGSLSLESAIAAYERGALLIGQLRKLLSGAEEKLKVLSRE